MQKLLITTRADSSIEYYTKYTHPIIKEYAKKCNADFLILDEDAPAEGDDNRAVYRIMQQYDLHDEYDRILCLDSDIIITPHAPNIFEYVPEDKIGSILEDTVTVERIQDRRSAIKNVQEHWENIGWKENYIQTGVFLTAKMHRDIFQPVDGQYWTGRGSDDIHLGYQIHKLGYEIFEIDFKYNHTDLYSQSRGGGYSRNNSYFVHYAGSLGSKKMLIEHWKNIYG